MEPMRMCVLWIDKEIMKARLAFGQKELLASQNLASLHMLCASLKANEVMGETRRQRQMAERLERDQKHFFPPHFRLRGRTIHQSLQPLP